MKTLKVGIISKEAYRKRVMDIATGRYTPRRGEPKVWFHSLKSLSEVLSENNIELLRLMAEQHPESISELAELSGRKQSNLSRTLNTMAQYGIVEMKRHNKTVQPIAKALDFNIVYQAMC